MSASARSQRETALTSSISQSLSVPVSPQLTPRLASANVMAFSLANPLQTSNSTLPLVPSFSVTAPPSPERAKSSNDMPSLPFDPNGKNGKVSSKQPVTTIQSLFSLLGLVSEFVLPTPINATGSVQSSPQPSPNKSKEEIQPQPQSIERRQSALSDALQYSSHLPKQESSTFLLLSVLIKILQNRDGVVSFLVPDPSDDALSSQPLSSAPLLAAPTIMLPQQPTQPSAQAASSNTLSVASMMPAFSMSTASPPHTPPAPARTGLVPPFRARKNSFAVGDVRESEDGDRAPTLLEAANSFLSAVSTTFLTPTRAQILMRRRPVDLHVSTAAIQQRPRPYVTMTYRLPSTMPPTITAAVTQGNVSADEATTSSWYNQCELWFKHHADWLASIRRLHSLTHTSLLLHHEQMVKRIDRFTSIIVHSRDVNDSVQLADATLYEQARRCIDSLHAKHSFAEQQRRAVARKHRNRKVRQYTANWKFLIRSLTNERGPWAQHKPTEHYWKVENTESYHRQHIKMKINYSGTDHSDAAADADKVKLRKVSESSSGRGEGVPENSQPPSPSLTATNEGGDGSELNNSDADLLQMAVKFSQSSAGALSPVDTAHESGEHLDDSMEESPKNESAEAAEETAAKTSALLDAAELENAVTLYHSIYSVNGSLILTSTHLYFEAKDEEIVDTNKSRNKRRRGSALSGIDESSSARSPPPKEQQQSKLRREYIWPLLTISAIYHRRHIHQRIALELFFYSQTNFMIIFKSEQQKTAMHKEILIFLRRLRSRSAYVHALQQTHTNRLHLARSLPFHFPTIIRSMGGGGPWAGSPMDVFKKSGLTQAWIKRKISNFDYLMHLNTLAGRTYNDLTQYPVMPWIIADYTSATLDLEDESKWATTFRDLTKPVGALNDARLQMYIERFQSMESGFNIPKFLYGTHYSNAGFVLFWLLRVEPYTSAAIALQEGKFDHADRLFQSMQGAWEGVLTNPADVKELIPEMFYLSEMFRNENELPLGFKQLGGGIGDVILPAWAHGSADEFVRIHRRALESEYVSLHLHRWIDLIFGYQQRGIEAEKANNVFYFLTYENGVDLDKIDDAGMRAASISQIQNFGKCPSQLLTTPHPQRQSAAESHDAFSIIDSINDLCIYKSERITARTLHDNPLLFLAFTFSNNTHDKLITVGLDRQMSTHKWKPTHPDTIPPYHLDLEKRKRMRRIGVPFAVGLNVLPHFFMVSACERYILSCGHWDHSIRVTTLDGYLHQSLCAHADIVTCMAMSEAGDVVVTGGKDATIMVWLVSEWYSGGSHSDTAIGITGAIGSTPESASDMYLLDRPRFVLYGHDSEVSVVAVSSSLDVVVSGSRDGTIIVHTLRTGRYTRTITPPTHIDQTVTSPLIGVIRWVGLTTTGDIITYSLVTGLMHLFTINARRLHSMEVTERLYCFVLNRSTEILIVGGERQQITFISLHNLTVIHRCTPLDGVIRSLVLTPDESQLLVGTSTGHMHIVAAHPRYVKAKMLQRTAH